MPLPTDIPRGHLAPIVPQHRYHYRHPSGCTPVKNPPPEV